MCDCNDLTKYDFIATDMRKYLGTYGAHFNRALCEFAVSRMRDAKGERVKMVDKNELNAILRKSNVSVKNDVLWDCVYVYCMATADFLGSSIGDEEHLAKYVKDYIDDPDGYTGIAFNRWYADCCKKGVVVDWEEFL